MCVLCLNSGESLAEEKDKEFNCHMYLNANSFDYFFFPNYTRYLWDHEEAEVCGHANQKMKQEN